MSIGKDHIITPSSGPGPLMIIGGAEDKLRRREVLTHFVEACGGPEARIAVIATASSLGPEVVEVYDALFRKLGAADVVSVRPESREEAHDPAFVDALSDVTGIYMTGGNQLKLSGVVCGTPFGEAIHAARERGAVIAGTSAGASIQSSHMVAFGVGGTTPKQRMTQVAAGLGLLRNSCVDQHFEQRNRYGRLLMIVAQSPQLIGMGVDEDTAAVVTLEEGREVLRVVGRGAVTLFDPDRMVTNAHEARRSAPLLASGVVLHVLPAGAEFDLDARALIPAEAVVDDSEAAEIAEVGRDLRRLARDIAAGDVSPTTLRRRIARSRRAKATPRPDPTEQSSQTEQTQQDGAST
ncbi:cyanophycinase [Nocardioides donggukensis]|uniref:Cyanophycinase n=1 Tax=Nocardioides donggukensis TaxID=2774019 RepID=A0A927K5L3_9ACTN|nr:cyanophycinase [Nocardioides donggukensis]MBD8869423.1 cyanophycinase [Nocardioides donggukensis]